jgi:hypothetical protein
MASEASLFDFQDGGFSGTIAMQGKDATLKQDFKGIRHQGGDVLRLDSEQIPAFWLEVRFRKHPMGQFETADELRYLVTAKGRMSDDPRLLEVNVIDSSTIEIKAVDGSIELVLPTRFMLDLE